jgi:hypothetical protein
VFDWEYMMEIGELKSKKINVLFGVPLILDFKNYFTLIEYIYSYI